MIRPLADTGFADESLVAPLLRRLRVRAALKDARSRVQTLLNLLDEQSEPLPGQRSALSDQGIGLTTGDEHGGVGCPAIYGAKRHAMREHELLEGVELFAQLLDRVEIGMRHGLFSCSSEQKASEAGQSAHRLCGDAK